MTFICRVFSITLMASSFLRFLDHTKRRITAGRTSLDEWSACRRDLYLTTHNTHNRQTSMPPGGIRTHDLSKGAAADLRLRPRGYWDRQYDPKLRIKWSLKLISVCNCSNVHWVQGVSFERQIHLQNYLQARTLNNTFHLSNSVITEDLTVKLCRD